VLAGSGTAGAYHAGVVKALDESGVKVDVVVGSGAGTVGAVFAALAGGERLHGPAAFWRDVTWSDFYGLRAALRLFVLVLSIGFGVFLLPVLLAVFAGLFFPLFLVADLVAPAWTARMAETLMLVPAALRTPYLGALAAPTFVLSLTAAVWTGVALLRDRRRLVEAFESPLTAVPLERRLRRDLLEVARQSALGDGQVAAGEVGRRCVAALVENLGQPGFRELVLRAADLETGAALSFVLLREPHRAAYLAARGRGRAGGASTVDLGARGYEPLLFPAVLAGLLPAPLAPAVRVTFPRGGLFGAETHRLADGALAGGCGISEALRAGAEQVIVACAVPEEASLPLRRRGPHAAAEGLVATLERQSFERELEQTHRLNRLVETMGHRTEDGSRAWEDPATGRLYRDVAVYVVRPERRALGPLDFDGVLDRTREVLETTDDLVDQGHRDAYRLFLEPVLGAAPDLARPSEHEPEERTLGL
jgi:predicted acylesterase/phospholipase RssA